ncbi:unnamed protein product [Allacma fusca]|uniref:DDE Tnp4 domain-containing protein n=1 Tax=Allacma fusca TaxID=39272 RepID=A0A8J2L6M4_9HEXA|nr:unnamed protein product [Allacma fusca]
MRLTVALRKKLNLRLNLGNSIFDLILILGRYSLGDCFRKEAIPIPAAPPCYSAERPHVFIGDEVFPLQANPLRPCPLDLT